jgi:hypothetical protein
VGVETDHCSPRVCSQLMRLRKPAGRYTLVPRASPSPVNDSCDTCNVPQEDSLGIELSDKRPFRSPSGAFHVILTPSPDNSILEPDKFVDQGVFRQW